MNKQKSEMKNITIGIVTFHKVINYGALFQAFALQEYIETILKFSVKIIDYQPKTTNSKLGYRIIARPKSLKELIKNSLRLFYYLDYRRKVKYFISFQKKYLNLTRRYYSFEELVKTPPYFDVYITGSDQTFHPLQKATDVFFLKFIGPSSKKISYAASMGISFIPESEKVRVKKSLEEYTFVSVREFRTKIFLEQFLEREIHHVADPVFLLAKSRWMDFTRPRKCKFNTFILCFSLVGWKNQMKLTKEIQKLMKLPIVLITDSYYPNIYADEIIRDCAPEEFLWFIANAEFVVTDSYHGTCFSILFNKNFYTVIEVEGTSERIVGLLELVNLADRYIRGGEFSREIKVNIDYEATEKKLAELISVSKGYLNQSLK